MDLDKCKVIQLKELLQNRRLSTAGCKAELIARLHKVAPNHDWTNEINRLIQRKSSVLTSVPEEDDEGSTEEDNRHEREDEAGNNRHTSEVDEQRSVTDRQTRCTSVTN